MATIDLDAARAARAEALKDQEAPTAVFRGEQFTLPLELPFGVFLRMAEVREDPEQSLEVLRSVIDTIFGEDAGRFLALGPSMDDMLALIEALMSSYEVDVPESQAQPQPS
jgi:hypothetical protein